MTKEQKLESIMRRSTKYELVAENGARRVLLGYTRNTRPGLLAMCRQNGEAVIKLTCHSGAELMHFGKNANAGATIGAWRIRFTGRTQREAIIEGELPFVCTEVL